MSSEGARCPVDRFARLPRLFVLYRREDVNGASGTGDVASGVVWPDGHAALRWKADDHSCVSSTSVWSSMADLLSVHGHDGRSEIVYLDHGGNRVVDEPWAAADRGA